MRKGCFASPEPSGRRAWCMRMIDGQGRYIDYARISITDRCNLRCIYCMPESGVVSVPHAQVLSYDEILRVCRVLAALGISKVKLTGGEPLARVGCAELLAEIKKVPGIRKVTLTTNGILLKEQMHALAEAGLDAVNISLDTLNRARFAQITRRDELSSVLMGIEEALRYPHIPVKINCVPLSEHEEDYLDLALLAKERPLHIRFIEMMPIGLGKSFSFQNEAALRRILEQAYGPLTPCNETLGNGPCRYYELAGFQGKIGFISALTHKFCESCNRVRLTAEGYLKTCLQYQAGTDLRAPLRNGCDDETLSQIVAKTILQKPACHHFHESDTASDELRGMSQIGG